MEDRRAEGFGTCFFWTRGNLVGGGAEVGWLSLVEIGG